MKDVQKLKYTQPRSQIDFKTNRMTQTMSSQPTSRYITNIKPLHPTKGNQTIISIREFNQTTHEGETYHILSDIPHRFFTKPISEQELSTLKSALDVILADIPHTSNTIFQYPNTILTLDAPKETHTTLPDSFITKLNQPFQHRYLQYPPSTYVRYIHPIISELNNPSTLTTTPTQINYQKPLVETIINDTHLTLDIELEGWKEGKDQIFMTIYLSQNHQILLHNLPFNQSQLTHPNLTTSQTNKTNQDLNNITILRYRTQQDLGEILTELIQTDDPLWVFGHNIMSFDQIKIRNITNAYYPGTQGKHPVIKSVQGLGKVLTQGRFTLDTHKFAKNHRSLFQNTKLETLVGFEKTINYEEQETLLAKAKKGDQNAFETLAAYCIMDGIHAQTLGLEMRPIVTTLAHFFGRDPDTICATSHPTIVNDYLERRYFLLNGYPSRKNVHTGIPNTSMKEYVHTLIKTNIPSVNSTTKPTPTTQPSSAAQSTINPTSKATSSLKYQQGFFISAHIISLTPALHAAIDFLQNTTLYYAATQTDDPIVKMDYLHSVQEITRPLYEQAAHLSTKVPPKDLPHALRRISRKYGLKPNHLIMFMQHFSSNVKRIQLRLQEQGYINSSPLLYVLQKGIDKEKLEKDGMGIYLGQGPTLSLSPGRFVTHPHIMNVTTPTQNNQAYPRLYQGVNATYHQKSTFEKETLLHIIDLFFNYQTKGTIKTTLNQAIESFNQGEPPTESYYITQKTRSFYKEEFSQVLMASTAPSETKIAYQKMKHRIHDHFSPEAKKELEEILEQTKDSYAHPYLRELHEKIMHSYPPTTTLMYAAGTEYTHTTKSSSELRALLRPTAEGHLPSLKIYQAKAERTFADIQKILNQKGTQLNLI